LVSSVVKTLGLLFFESITIHRALPVENFFLE
jgi:hypothetical protein